jgi:RNA polymerase sigma factor (sigma-70 family)
MSTTDREPAIWKGLSNRDELRTNGPGSEAEQTRRESFIKLVSPHLDRLKEFVRHALDYAVANSDLPRDELTVDDVVDETVVQAYNHIQENAVPDKVEARLAQLAADQIEAAIKRVAAESKELVHIEENVPETPREEEVSTLGDEILDFFQPDEDLRLEDIVPDLEVPTPEEETSVKELRECVRRALNALPETWRRVLLLHYVEGVKDEQLAKAIGKPIREVQRIQGSAAKYLRQRLEQSGCTFRRS